MGRILKHSILLLAAILLVGVAACNSDEGCEGNTSSMPLAGFYSSQTKKAITIDSLTVFGVGVPNDSLLLDTAQASQTYLPLDIEKTQARFVIRYDQQQLAALKLADTITIDYSPRPYFHSEECGAMYYFDVKGYRTTNVLIDSMQIITPVFDNTTAETIKIYFRTGADTQQ